MQAEQRFADALVLEVPGADDRLVPVGKSGEELVGVDVVAFVAHEHEVHRNLLVQLRVFARLQVPVIVGLAEAGGRHRGQREHANAQHD